MKSSKLLILALLATMAPLHAQAANVPELLSYQAFVSDASGNPIGAAQPVNRTVTFKLYDAATGGNLLYAESQTVTIAGGNFSVLIGNGVGIAGLPGPSAPANPSNVRLGTIAKGPLYLGITVDDGTPAADPEISPRQQLVSSAFTLRAAVAEALASGSLKTEMIDDASVTTNKIVAGGITTSRIADANITTAKLASSSVTASKINTSEIGIWTPHQNHVFRPAGTHVGIGQSQPAFPLHFASGTGNKIALSGDSGNHYGLGVQSNLLQIYSNGSSSDIAFGFGSSTAFTENLRFKGNGNVGIGTNNPAQKLHIVGNALATPANWTSGGTAHIYLGDTNHFVSATQNGVLALRSAGVLSLRSGGDTERARLDSNGNLGINTGAPADRLHVNGSMRASTVHANGARSSHDQGAHLQWNKVSGTGATYLLNQKGSGSGGIIMGEITTGNSITERLVIQGDGRVRIGTTETLGLLNVGSVTASYRSNGRLTTNGGSSSNDDMNNVPLSINCVGRVYTTQVDINSDQRIKTGLHPTDPAADLATLLGIAITDYRHTDTITHGSQHHKKVIAQQVEEVFPQAVSQSPGAVPDVLSHARITDDWLEITGDFQPGERLLVLGNDGHESILKILAVRPGAVQLEPSGFSGEIFVYGRHVDDFRRVDYDAIAMLNVSATQELHRRLAAAEEAVTAKDRRIDELESRLAAIEEMLASER